jgi:hypothetical protein
MRLKLGFRVRSYRQRLRMSGAMTMYDAVVVSRLPRDGGAYAGYVDGSWATMESLPGMFPDTNILSVTTGLGAAQGIDVEPGNEGWNNECAAVPGWVQSRIEAGVHRPVIYIAGSSMQLVIDRMNAAGISRDKYRLWSAHWDGSHICGPASCRLPEADATQWACVNNLYDVSLLNPGFFDQPAPGPKPVPVPKPTPPPAPPLIEDDDMNQNTLIVEAKGPAAGGISPGALFAIINGQKLPLKTLTLATSWANALGQPLPGTPHAVAWLCSDLALVPSVA